MTDRPIIFSAAMVRALIREAQAPGTGKTQTRRVLKPQPVPFAIDEAGTPCEVGCLQVSGERQPRITTGRVVTRQKVPYAVGDRLWAREAVRRAPDAWTYEADGERVGWPGRRDLQGRKRDTSTSLFLPRSASRLTLIVTDVRVERLASISREDAIAEGATMRPRAYRGIHDGWCMDWSPVGQPSRFAANGHTLSEEDICFWRPEDAFGSFINELHDPRWNYKGDGICGENPRVVAITFRPILANIDAHPRDGGLQDEGGVRG